MNTEDIKTKLRRTATFIICRNYAIEFHIFDAKFRDDANSFDEDWYETCCCTSYEQSFYETANAACKMYNCSRNEINEVVLELIRELLLNPSAKGWLRHIADRSSKVRDDIRKYFVIIADNYGYPTNSSDKIYIDLWRAIK